MRGGIKNFFFSSKKPDGGWQKDLWALREFSSVKGGRLTTDLYLSLTLPEPRVEKRKHKGTQVPLFSRGAGRQGKRAKPTLGYASDEQTDG